jgi:hypothetical protein
MGYIILDQDYLPSGLVKILDPNFPPMTKVTRFIVSPVFRYAYLSTFISSLPFLPNITFVIYLSFKLCILGESYGRIACFQFIHLSKPTWFKMFT